MAKTLEESMALINERAKVNGDGRFIVKLSRRKAAIGTLQHVATLVDVHLAHIGAVETWVPRLFGGGPIYLSVFHADEPATRIGDILEFNFAGEPYPQPDFGAIPRAGSLWQGPTVITFPEIGASGAQLNTQPSQVSVPGSASPAPSFQQGYGAPPQGAAPIQQAVNPGISQGDNVLLQRERELIAREQAMLQQASNREEALRKEIAQREASIQQQQFESRLRAEADRAQAALNAQLAEMKQLLSVQQAPKPESNSIEKIGAMLAPMILEMQRQSFERNQAATKQQNDMMAMFLAQSNKPAPGMTPEMMLLIETLKGQSGGSAEMMSRIVDAMSTVSKTSVGMIEAIADLNLGGAPEHPILMAVKEGVKAMAHLSRGAESAARAQLRPRTGPAPQMPGQMPQQFQRQQQQLAPQPVAAAPLIQMAPQPQAVRASNGATAPATPAPEVLVQPVAEPVANHPPAFDGLPPAAAAAPLAPSSNSVDQLEVLIRSRHEPRDEVVRFFFAALDTDEMKSELMKYNGDVDEMVMGRLGPWIEENIDNAIYIKELSEMISEVGEERGMWADEEEPEEGAAEAAES